MHLLTNYKKSTGWIKTNLGEYVLSREMEALLRLLHKDIKILYNSLVIGEPEFFLNLSKLFNLLCNDKNIKQFMLHPILNRLDIEKSDFFSKLKNHLIIAKQYKLPIDNNIIDLVFLPHNLESLNDYWAVLTEVYRVLKPGGRIIITGFNKHIFWWICSKFISKKLNPILSKNKHFTINQVKYWLILLGFDEIHVEYDCYNLLINNKVCLKYFRFLEKIGKFFPFINGNIYAISARKSVIPLTSIYSKEWDEVILDNDLAKNLLDS